MVFSIGLGQPAHSTQKRTYKKPSKNRTPTFPAIIHYNDTVALKIAHNFLLLLRTIHSFMLAFRWRRGDAVKMSARIETIYRHRRVALPFVAKYRAVCFNYVSGFIMWRLQFILLRRLSHSTIRMNRAGPPMHLHKLGRILSLKQLLN